MQSLKEYPGINVGGQNVNTLRYPDDTVLITFTENKEDLQQLLDITEEERRKKKDQN